MPWVACLWAACLSAVISGGADGELGPPPVLTEPERAQMWANASVHLDPGAAAEVALHAGDPRRTLEILERTSIPLLRLRLDALIRLGTRSDLEEALRVAHDLAVVPGWRTHAASAERGVRSRLFGARLGRIGLGLYAACLGALLVGGGRALLRLRVGELLAFVCFAGGVMVGSAYSPALRPTLALGAMAVSTLTHAASATVARTIARPKARLLLVTLFLMGTVGVAFALAESALGRGLVLL